MKDKLTELKRDGWMRIGQVVAVNGKHWYGRIADVAETDAGRIMLLIDSPKAVWRNHRPEWLEYIPGQIRPCAAKEALERIDSYERYVEEMQARIKEMRDELEREVDALQLGKTERPMAAHAVAD